MCKVLKDKKLAYLLVISYMGLIFYLSSIPLKFPEIVDVVDPSKFLFHIIEYSVLSVLLFNASHNLKFSFLVSGVYGISDEIHQYFVPFRYFDFYDLLADWIGSFIGAFLMFKLHRLLLKLKTTSR